MGHGKPGTSWNFTGLESHAFFGGSWEVIENEYYCINRTWVGLLL